MINYWWQLFQQRKYSHTGLVGHMASGWTSTCDLKRVMCMMWMEMTGKSLFPHRGNFIRKYACLFSDVNFHVAQIRHITQMRKSGKECVTTDNWNESDRGLVDVRGWLGDVWGNGCGLFGGWSGVGWWYRWLPGGSGWWRHNLIHEELLVMIHSWIPRLLTVIREPELKFVISAYKLYTKVHYPSFLLL